MEAEGDSRLNVNLGASHATNIDQPPSPLTEQEHGSTHSNQLDNDQVPIKDENNNNNSSNTCVKDDINNNNNSNTCVKDDINSNNSNTCVKDGINNDVLGLNSQPASSTCDSDAAMQNQQHACKTTSTKLESDDSFQDSEEGHQNIDDAKRSSDGEIQTSSIPKHELLDDATEQQSASISPKEAEIQNPQVQVMERTNESGANSSYVFPSHVFARNSTNAPVEWSTASNESLFSIYMGNMSFSSELALFKSGELDNKPCDVYVSDQPNASPIQQPPTPVNKFNDISQRTAELHEEGLKVTEAKAAETMREVIMESSQTTEENTDKVEQVKKSNSRRQSDGSTKSYAFGSTKSYAFQTSTSKSASSKGGAKDTNAEPIEQTKADDSTPKSNTNPPPNTWLNCFSCCTFCH